jgi:cell wall assembly regulator SMI1
VSRKPTAVNARVKDAWKRITRWYKVHVPADEFLLADGAAAEDIAATEAHLGLRFPPELVASYRLHNGSRETAVLGYGYSLLPLAEVVAQWGIWKRLVDEGTFEGTVPDSPSAVRKVWWNVKWIPFTHNGGGDHHCVDMDPAARGTVGQVIQFNHEVGVHSVLAPDFATYLTQFASNLEAGHYRFDPDDLWVVEVPKKRRRHK